MEIWRSSDRNSLCSVSETRCIYRVSYSFHELSPSYCAYHGSFFFNPFRYYFYSFVCIHL